VNRLRYGDYIGNHLDRLVDKKNWSHIFSSTIFLFYVKKTVAQVLAPKTLNKDKKIVVATHGWNNF
jgi:hypothetical protein